MYHVVDFLSEDPGYGSSIPGGLPLVPPFYDIGEGTPGESGSAAARNLAQLPTSLPAVPDESAFEGKGSRRAYENKQTGECFCKQADLCDLKNYETLFNRVHTGFGKFWKFSNGIFRDRKRYGKFTSCVKRMENQPCQL